MSKVLYIAGGRSIFSDNPGRKISSFLACWKKLGFEVKAICGGDILPNSSNSQSREYGKHSFHRQWYRRVEILNPLIRSVSERRDIHHDMEMLRHLELQCKAFKPDIVWERSCRLHCAGLKLARQFGVPYVLEWKDNIAAYSLSLHLHRARRMEHWKNEEADFIVTESEVLRVDLIQQGINSDKIIVAHNAVDPQQFRCDAQEREETRKRLGISKDTVLIGYLGSYAWYHSTCLLIEAMAKIQERGINNVCCLMVGSGKEYDKAHRLAARRNLLQSSMMMIPGVPKDEVPGILSALDIAVLPGSTDIICPIKIQEYMASELATIAPDYACNREVINHEETGLLFQPADEKALADAILLLANDSGMRERMGRLAREDVKRRFTWESTWGAALEEILRRIRTTEKNLQPSNNNTHY
ncbi:glycosyltransferase family 4 protein [Candidatus Sumerlaeota bacterium]|nr:glycosyltransferase family 4 protein [Candidatus Sumerlaeota bacterium]